MSKDTIKTRRPKPGMWIVWRYKGDRGWQVNYVRESFGAGYVVHLTDNEYGSGFGGVRVCADDIDWKIK
jgi:hypothetical protein